MTQRLAVVTTAYRYQSHAQHLVDPFLTGYPRDGLWHRPDLRIVSLYADQKPDGDLSAPRAAEFGFRLYPAIAETLCCGGDKLAVDAVLIAAGHGQYPRNEKGQVLDPRYEFFAQCVDVFERSRRTAPIYIYPHLSYSFEKARWMADAALRLNFPLLAGSALPVTWRLPDLELPPGCGIEDALMVGAGGPDAVDDRALEAMQSMLERRRGGETGVKAVCMIEGDEVWQAGRDGRWPPELLGAALSRSDTPQGLTLQDGRPQDLAANGELPKLVPKPAACFFEYRDGLRATLLMLTGAVRDFTFAARLKDLGILSTQFLLTPEPNAPGSARLVRHIEEMFLTGRKPYPLERSLMVCGMLESCLDSRGQGSKRLETPHLDVQYQLPGHLL